MQWVLYIIKVSEDHVRHLSSLHAIRPHLKPIKRKRCELLLEIIIMCRCMLINYNTSLHVFASEPVFSPLADQLVNNG